MAKADSKLYNQASQVVIARNGDRTVLTMANDYQGRTYFTNNYEIFVGLFTYK